MLTNISIPGVKCDCCGKEEALLAGYPVKFRKITIEEVIPPGETKQSTPEEKFICADCFGRLTSSYEDISTQKKKIGYQPERKPDLGDYMRAVQSRLS